MLTTLAALPGLLGATLLLHTQRHRALPPDQARRLQGAIATVRGFYRRALRAAGRREPPSAFAGELGAFALATAAIPVLPLTAARGQLPSPALLVALAAVGIALAHLRLQAQIRHRKEQIFLALPNTLTLLALALSSGKSLAQALHLAAEEPAQPLAVELAVAITLARRDPRHDERTALLATAQAADEPHFVRFAELLARKESPYSDFLHTQAAQLRAEHDRYLDQAADRAYLRMHLPVAPLLATLVLLLTYGFLHSLTTPG